MTSVWRSFWGAIALMGAAGVAAAIWQMPEPLRNNVAAAWVQAIGSIAAIVAAAFISDRATRDGRKTAFALQNREASGRLEVAMFVAHQVVMLAYLVKARVGGASQAITGSDFDSILDAIDKLPLADLSSGRFVQELLAMRRVLNALKGYVASFEGAKSKSYVRATFAIAIMDRIATLEKVYVHVEEAYADALEKVGRDPIYEPRP
jgi:hypothetical protein